MVLSNRAFRLYLKYKLHSGDLFKELVAPDISTLDTWPGKRIEQHEAWLSEGYVRNCVCLGARKKFRDDHVPLERQDRGHEEAIENAEQNCAFYAKHYKEFREALQRCQQHLQHTEGQVGGQPTRPPEVKESGNVDVTPPDADVPDDSLLVAWEEAMKLRAQAESDLTQLVGDMCDRATKELQALKVTDDELPAVMRNLLNMLSPSTAADRNWAEEVTMKDIEEKCRSGLLEDEVLRGLVIKAAVKHRKTVRQLTTFDGYRFVLPHTADAVTRKKNETVLLLHMIHEARPGTLAGTNAWQVTHYVRLREAAISYVRSGSLPPVTFQNKPPPHLLNGSVRAVAGHMAACGPPGGLPTGALPATSIENDFAKTWTSFKALWKKICVGKPQAEPFLRTFLKVLMRLTDGAVDLPAVLIHPAKFLCEAARMPSHESVIRVGDMLRVGFAKSEPRIFHALLNEVYGVVCTARALFDIQYYHHYEAYYASGKMPKELTKRNPFEEDEGNIVRMCADYEAKRRMKGTSERRPTHLFIQSGGPPS